jgi:hypothetical protein
MSLSDKQRHGVAHSAAGGEDAGAWWRIMAEDSPLGLAVLEPGTLRAKWMNRRFQELLEGETLEVGGAVLNNGLRPLVQFLNTASRTPATPHRDALRLMHRGRAHLWETSSSPAPAGGPSPDLLIRIHDVTDQELARERLQRETLEPNLLYRMSVLAAESDSLEAVVQGCLDAVCELAGWPLGHAYVYDEEESLVSTRVWHVAPGRKMQRFADVTETLQFAVGEGFPGRVLATREPVWLPNVQQEPEFRRAAIGAEVGIRGAFAFPILVQGQVKAVLEFFSLEERSPDQALIMMVRTAAEQVGRVIERRQRESELRTAQQELKDFVENAVLGLQTCDLRWNWRRGRQFHNGRAWVESTAGEGATFYLAFPCELLRP